MIPGVLVISRLPHVNLAKWGVGGFLATLFIIKSPKTFL